MMNIQLATGWIEAWNNYDMQWLRQNLAPDFVHTSPFGTLEGREFYLATVAPMAKKSVQQLNIIQVIDAKNQAAIWFENVTEQGAVPSCDWLQIEDKQIKSIQSFYDSVKIKQILSDDEQDKLNNRHD